MNTDQAQSAVALSAFVIAGIFAYRKLTEQALPNNAKNPVPQTAHFVIGFGFTFIFLSLMAQAAPTFGGMMAILVATGDFLVNGQAILSDVTTGLKQTQTATGR